MQVTFATEEKLYTIEEYLEKEVRSEEKHEYFDKKIVLRKSVQLQQNLIATNILYAINLSLEQLTDTDLMVVGSGLLTYIPQFNYILYPGAGLVFRQPQFLTTEENVLLNPVLVVEVSSASDTIYNHSSRFWYYKTLPSFKEYVFIEQDTSYVTTLYKSAENTWVETEANTLAQSILLKSINCSIDLKRIYKWVEFEKGI